jgi:hypothetical protein
MMRRCLERHLAMKRMSTAIYWQQSEESTVVIRVARTAFGVDRRYVQRGEHVVLHS